MNGKTWVLVLAALAVAGRARGQDVGELLGRDSVDWAAWETVAAKEGLLERLGICVGVDGMVEGHHFLDFSGDGVTDLIYSGRDVGCDYPAADGQRTVFFLAEDGELREIFVHNGRLAGMWREAGWQPVSFVIRTDGCCGDAFVHYTYFYPVLRRGKLHYEPYDHLVSVYGAPLPRTMFRRPRAFMVEEVRQSLRVTPAVDDDYRWPFSRPFDPTGNLMASYREGAKGVALGTVRDEKGGAWWFVVMDAASRPLSVRGFQGEWERPRPGQQLMGWMRRSGLREVSEPPGKLDLGRYWRNGRKAPR